jgi:alpha-amylase
VFVDNRDTGRNGSTLAYGDGATYTLANIFMPASSCGSPNVCSGYEWSDKDAGPPSGSDGWTGTHAGQEITGMGGFRDAVGPAESTDRWDNGFGAVAFGHGDRGHVAVNAGDGELTQTFATPLPPGTYRNVVEAAPSARDGNTVTAGDDGTAQVTVPAQGAAAFRVGARSRPAEG